MTKKLQALKKVTGSQNDKKLQALRVTGVRNKGKGKSMILEL
jgi:hypothetical protein